MSRAAAWAGANGGALNYLSLNGPDLVPGTTVTLNIGGATTGSALTATGLPSGWAINSGARTVSGPVTDTLNADIVIIETLAGKANSPRQHPFKLKAKLPVASYDPAAAELARFAASADPWATARGATGFHQVARHLLSAAQRPLGDISAVLGTPPTITDPASTGNSTIITSATTAQGGGSYNAENPLHCKIAGNAAIVASTPQLISRGDFALGGHSASANFSSYASVVDFALKVNGSTQKWIAYVTDALTGVRARIAANDRGQTAAGNIFGYYKLDFGGVRALRHYEIALNPFAQIRGINVPTTDSIWPYDPQEPRIGAIGSSTWDGAMNNDNLKLKAAMADHLLALFGARSGFINGVPNTGVLASNASNHYNFMQRLQAGDMDASRIGHLHLFYVTGSTNDNAGPYGTADDAVFRVAWEALLLRARQAQPRAIIVGLGPTSPYGSPTGQSRYAAHKQGFQNALGNDPGAFFIDSGPDGGNYMFGTSSSGINQTIVGADTIHLNDLTGVRYYADRLFRDTIAGLQRIAGS